MMKTGSVKMFSSMATASIVIESMRILMRSRQGGVKLMLSSVRDQFHAAYLSTSGAGGENVSETLSLLSDSQTVRVSMAQTRQPLTDKY